MGLLLQLDVLSFLLFNSDLLNAYYATMAWESTLQQGFSTFFQPLTLSTLDLESSDKAYRVLLKKAVCVVPRPVGSSEAKRKIPPASKAKKTFAY